jgi:hypothetical protein
VNTRTCRTCQESKPLDAFQPTTNGNRRHVCRSCRVDYGRQWQRDNPEAVKVRNLRWVERNPDRFKANTDRANRRRHQHGLSDEEFAALVAAHDGLCGICRNPEKVVRAGRTGRLSIDHDHSCHPGTTGCRRCIRGLLCVRCNDALARVERGEREPTEAMVEYLAAYAARSSAVTS